jgi:mycobactin lysine-N-oxygenase
VADAISVRADIAVLGAGPKAAALAAKTHVLNELGYGPLRIAVVEQKEVGASWTGRHGFTSGLELLGTRPEKDVGFPYQSARTLGARGADVDAAMLRFSWHQYLVELGEYRRWVDAGALHPTHREVAEYVSWVLARASNGVEVHMARVVKVRLHPDGWVLEGEAEGGRREHLVANRGLVLTGPGRPRSLQHAEDVAPRIITPAMTRTELRRLCLPPAGRVCIVGSGESGAALALWLIHEFGDELELTFVAPSLPYSRAESFLENSVYSDPQLVAWGELAEPMRREFVRRTDRGVLSPAALSQLSRHRKLTFVVGRVQRVERGPSGLARVVVDDAGRAVGQEFDAVAVCTGSCALTTLVNLLGDARQPVEAHLGFSLTDEPTVMRSLDATLALRALAPRIHLPALAGLAHGPGFANLSCLGTLSDHVLSAYVSAPPLSGGRPAPWAASAAPSRNRAQVLQ